MIHTAKPPDVMYQNFSLLEFLLPHPSNAVAAVRSSRIVKAIISLQDFAPRSFIDEDPSLLAIYAFRSTECNSA